ncbi:MAG: sugar ABC transporter permease [Clostridiales bacterium]|nr:sugar ABC transporter permease [Clostridiales bacterium]
MLRDKKYMPYLLIAPAILILILLSYLPLPYAFYLSVHTTVPVTGQQVYVGMENFTKLFKLSNFWESLRNTFQYTAMCTGIMLLSGTLMALAINSGIRGRSSYLTILFIPWVISDIVVSTTWKFMFNVDFGLLNYLFSNLGLRPSDLLTKPKLAMWGICVVTLWKTLAYSTLLLVAGLQNISKEYTEASRIDGCSARGTLWYVTLPLLRPTLLIVALLYIISCINQSGLILVLTNGGPLRSTETLALYLYKQAFLNYQLTNTAAMSIVLATINSAIVILYFVVNRLSSKGGNPLAQ